MDTLILASNRFDIDWNGPIDRPYEPFLEEWKDIALIELFRRVVARQPDCMALSDTRGVLTYAETLRRVDALAKVIAARTKTDDLVGLLLPPSTGFAVAVLACLAAGRVFVPLDLHYPAQWIANVIEDSKPTALLCDGLHGFTPDFLPEAALLIDISATGPSADEENEPEPFRPRGPDEPALVLFTSGSTGRPKGIVNSQRNMAQRAELAINATHLNAEDRLLALASPCTAVGLTHTLMALLAGSAIHWVDANRIGARDVFQILVDCRITVLFTFPALMRSILQLASQPAPETVRIFRTGGDTLLWSDIRLMREWLRPGALIQLTYAATEAPIMQWFVDESTRGDDNRIPVGYPLPGNELLILDDEGEPVADGEAGELFVRSRYTMLGLWRDGGCVPSEAVTPDPHDPAIRTVRIGDLVQRRPDGLVDRLGRKDRQVKIGGVRIVPDAIEAVLRSDARLRDAAVVVKSDGSTFFLLAFVMPRGQPDPALLEDLRALLKAETPRAMYPRRIHLVPDIPRLPSGKPDVASLGALDEQLVAAEASKVDPAAADPSGDTVVARAVRDAWERALGVGAAARAGDFFDLGGDSLKAITLFFEIERALGVALPLTLLYEAPHFDQLVRAIESRAESRFSPLVLIKAGAGCPPLFLIHGLEGHVMELFPLGRRLETPGPVYALAARGLDGREPPHASIEAMAADYLAAIRTVQPDGPYYLAGYSFGGLVAFEMAKSLRSAGEAVGLLGLVDTIPSQRQWPIRLWLSVFGARLAHHAKALRERSPLSWPGYAAEKLAALYPHAAWYWGRERIRHSPVSLPDLPPVRQAVQDAGIRASARYRLTFYPGEAVLFRAEQRAPWVCDPQLAWRPHCRTLTMRNMPGDHETMIQIHVDRLAAEMLPFLAPPSAGATPPD
jgi:acyl-coenzyme A synthetase/AMP-(fatty) acid ligase/thioesterase domain-containing protein